MGAPIADRREQQSPQLQQQMPQPAPRRPIEETKRDLETAGRLLSGEMSEEELKRAEPEKAEDPEGGPTLGDLKDDPPWDWGGYRGAMEQSEKTFQDKGVREAVEARLSELPIEDIVLYESVSQRHEIIPGVLSVTFRSLTASEDLALKRMTYETSGSDRYVLDRLILMTLTCGLVDYQGHPLPDHLVDKEGRKQFDVDAFNAKFAEVERLGLHVIGMLSVVYSWFDERVRNTLIDGMLKKS